MWKKSDLDRLHDAIYHRKSVRKFEQKAIEQEALGAILQRTTELTAPSPESPVAFRILTDKQIKGMISAKTPHYLAVYANDDLGSLVNASCMMQQMDLWLNAQGLGSCWLGMPRPTPETAKADGLPFVIVLAFGRPAEEPHRKDITEFKRKSLSEITDLSGMEQLLEPVRLAPSAVNRQPWHLLGSAYSLRLCCKKNNILQKAMFGDMPYMDMGIALCHLWLSAEKENRFLSFERETNPKGMPNGYEYVWTVHLKS